MAGPALLLGLLLGTGPRAFAHDLHRESPAGEAGAATAEIDRLREAERAARGAGAAWTAEDERHLRRRASDEEILYREALYASSAGTDPAVQRRLRALAAQLDAGQVGEGTEMEAQARQLGLDRRDLVLRRYLVESMRLALATPPADWSPAEADVRRYFETHRAEFVEPGRVRLTQIFLSRERRGEAAEAQATQLRERLERDAVRPDDGVEQLGDAFPRGSSARGTPAELARTFGASFAGPLRELPTGRWVGPVPSTAGFHVVWIHEREREREKPLTTVWARIVLALRSLEGERLYRSRIEELRTRHQASVPPAAPAGEPPP